MDFLDFLDLRFLRLVGCVGFLGGVKITGSGFIRYALGSLIPRPLLGRGGGLLIFGRRGGVEGILFYTEFYNFV